ncbi:uncharacterized protein BDW43DRAFT_298676 [Aspergillus alliaceus]|uniref:uncharacterized protein n=1 Tax=Petromyces alliaceus TaxID=209559 RepID=UPI0012A47807|nr:uncharacterized protein BDW43DRAFT_298676 [Aspergillus alliaceus]KAB8235616.1 hypothetical protein BDW43DRAFT_298676 [Aspergillus alliaceus]
MRLYIQSCRRIVAEGGFNKVFRLVMGNGASVTARISYPNVGHSCKTTVSEVAAMDFCGDAENPVESEYILVNLKLQDKLKIVDEIVRSKVNVYRSRLVLSHSSYGSLYFADNSFPGCEKAEATSDIPESKKMEVDRRFFIGPVAKKEFWDKERAVLDMDQGPSEFHVVKHCNGYLKAIAQREITWISRYATPKEQDLPENPEAQHSSDAHIELYEKFLSVFDYLFRMTTGRPGPLLLQARYAKFVQYEGEMLLELLKYYGSIKNEDERCRVRQCVEKSVVLQAYKSNTERADPILHEKFHTPHGRTRSFSECLIRLTRYWGEINNKVSCPILFSDEDKQIHYREGEGWNDQEDFWDLLDGLVDPPEMFVEARERALQGMAGEGRANFAKEM